MIFVYTIIGMKDSGFFGKAPAYLYLATAIFWAGAAARVPNAETLALASALLVVYFEWTRRGGRKILK